MIHIFGMTGRHESNPQILEAPYSGYSAQIMCRMAVEYPKGSLLQEDEKVDGSYI